MERNFRWRWRPAAAAILIVGFLLAVVSAERGRKLQDSLETAPSNYLLKAVNFLWKADGSSYEHVWPPMEFSWQIVVGSIIGFFGAAFGSIGGVGGGGIFVPMLTLVVGFDPKSSTAISKCMIMGAAMSTVYYNLKLRHPTLDMPIIDYDLALLIQPMLMLGISIGVIFNVVFADWMVTVLLIILFLGTSTKAFMKGVETWNKETLLKRETNKRLETNNGSEEVEYRPLPTGPGNGNPQAYKTNAEPEVPILENICWKELGLLVFVWMAFLALQITKNYTATCSTWYWVLNLLQIPVSLAVTLYETTSLYKGKRVIASKGDDRTNLKIHQLVLYCFCGVIAGIVGGLLGIDGWFIMGPLFLELGIPPQIPVSLAVTLYETTGLYKGKRVIASKGDDGTNLKIHHLVLYCFCCVIAGIVGGLLGIGGGFIMAPLFLELGIPPQEDAHEFLNCLLNHLHNCCLDAYPSEKLSSLEEGSFVNQVFGGLLKSQV